MNLLLIVDEHLHTANTLVYTLIFHDDHIDSDTLSTIKYIKVKDVMTLCRFTCNTINSYDKPAIEKSNGIEAWCMLGVPHRTNGPAWINPIIQEEIWLRYDRFHRIDGPAVSEPNLEIWHFDGKLHRTDGPAVYGKYEEKWFINGILH